jgi:hypothetical protein
VTVTTELPLAERLIGEGALSLREDIDQSATLEEAWQVHRRVDALTVLLMDLRTRSQRHLDRLKKAAR